MNQRQYRTPRRNWSLLQEYMKLECIENQWVPLEPYEHAAGTP